MSSTTAVRRAAKGAAGATSDGPPTLRTGRSWDDVDDLRWAARRWAARIGVTLRAITLRPMRTKWASVSTAGRLTLNTDLLGLPADLGELVIVHELVHLLMPNHGRVWKSFMAAYLPDWEERQQRLDAISRADRGDTA